MKRFLALALLLFVGSANAQTPAGRPFFESINNRIQFPGHGVKCDWNAATLTGTDDTAAMNAALATFTTGTVAEIAPGRQCLIDSGNLIVPGNVTIRGMASPGQPNGVTAAILSDASALIVNPTYTIAMGPGSQLRSLKVYRKGLIPNASIAQVQAQVATWAAEESVGISVGLATPGVLVEDVMVVGFNLCFKAQSGRYTIRNFAGDCANGVDAVNTGDVSSIDNARFEPFYRTGAPKNMDGVRPGAAFHFHDGGGAVQVSNSFAFMYAYGALINSASAIWFVNTSLEWHDNLSPTVRDTTCVRLTGIVANIWLNGINCAAFDRGLVNEAQGSGNYWSLPIIGGNKGERPTAFYAAAAGPADPPTMTFAGTLVPGDTINATVTDGTNVPGSPLTVSYTIQAGDTLLKASRGLARRLNTAWQLSKNYISFTAIIRASFTGSISGTTLTVTGVTQGTLAVGQVIHGVDIPVTPATTIVSIDSGTGGVGTYTLSVDHEIASENMLATADGLTVRYPVDYTTGAFTCGGTGGMTCAIGTGVALIGSTTMVNLPLVPFSGHFEVGLDGGPTNAVTGFSIYNAFPSTTQPVGSWLQVGAGSVTLNRIKVFGFVASTVTSANLSGCGSGPAFQASASSDVAGVIRTGTGATGCTLTFQTPYWATPYCDVRTQNTGGDTGVVQTVTVSTTALVVTTSARATFSYRCDINGPRMTGTYTLP